MTVAVLVLISITVITLDERSGTHHITSGLQSVANDVFSPVRSGVDDVLQPIGDFFAGAVNYGSLQQENARLRTSIGRLQEQQAELGPERRQAATIHALQHLPFVGSIPFVTAQVTELGTSNYASTVRIDKGRADGLTVGMPVVANGGLAGQVTQASHHGATITLITDGQSRVGATLQSSGAMATVVGQGSGQPLTADYVAPTTQVKNGELLSTNGLQGAEYPAGLPVARVTSHHAVSGANQQMIRLAPAADLDALAYVDVLLWQGAP